MKRLTFLQSLKTFTILAICSTVFAFSSKAGGDVYQIYLNNKLILKQFVIEPFNLQKLGLDKAKPGDELIVNYSHCGLPGKGRRILIKDEKGETLKEWKFADAVGSATGMKIKVEELIQLQKKSSNLSLHYTAQQLPKGRTLAFVQRLEKSASHFYRGKDFYHFGFSLLRFS